MDELSWRAKLLKSNINITSVDYKHRIAYVDFAYRPWSGKPQKWGKTIVNLVQYEDIVGTVRVNWDDTAKDILNDVLSLRKELEG